MAITKTLIEAIPHEDASNQVEHWDLTMVYEQGDKTLMQKQKNILMLLITTKVVLILPFMLQNLF